ncbi:hypothetical protein OPS25_02940 [Alteromonas ponticola]|uniref:Tetratricopeptide repeat protein n=1 Tax=Alteromonas aquimaris TaxID=2998417 RepID=A0ABT3P3V8_9ALTE|nr:hypothetical protein [Alteromonas aquimaris]MCW8107459.1 hypothetical protein [Alteromonas aquimaris]
MRKKWRLVICFIVSSGTALGNSANSKEVHYPEDDKIIAEWAVIKNENLTAKQAIDLLDKAAKLNSSAIFEIHAKQTLEQLENMGTLEPDALFLKAKLLQREHQFTDSKATLTQLLEFSPNYVGAHLLMASVLINQGNYNEAALHCQRIVGQVNYVIAMTCLFETKFEKQPSDKLYRQLLKISRLSNLTASDFIQWNAEVLAYMAYTLNQPLLAIKHLANINLEFAPISLIALWADAHMAIGDSAKVLCQLEEWIHHPENVDDAILLRLALAEKSTRTSHKWQGLLAQRVQHREWRDDFQHAGQLAQYYMLIKPNKQKAQKFARKNWQYAKSAEDRRLLETAEKWESRGSLQTVQNKGE